MSHVKGCGGAYNWDAARGLGFAGIVLWGQDLRALVVDKGIVAGLS